MCLLIIFSQSMVYIFYSLSEVLNFHEIQLVGLLLQAFFAFFFFFFEKSSFTHSHADILLYFFQSLIN